MPSEIESDAPILGEKVREDSAAQMDVIANYIFAQLRENLFDLLSNLEGKNRGVLEDLAEDLVVDEIASYILENSPYQPPAAQYYVLVQAATDPKEEPNIKWIARHVYRTILSMRKTFAENAQKERREAEVRQNQEKRGLLIAVRRILRRQSPLTPTQ